MISYRLTALAALSIAANIIYYAEQKDETKVYCLRARVERSRIKGPSLVKA